MTAFANVNGETVIELSLHIPNIGPWWADVVFELAPNLSGRVTLNVGSLQLSGTIREREDGTFGEQRRSRIVAGAGGWGTLVTPQHYHSDSGVNAISVAQDAARLAGETLGTFNPENAQLGVDYVRQSGTASRALEDVIGNVPWYVDYSGNTIVGARATSQPDEDSYEVLIYDPRERLVTVTADDLSLIGIGSVLTKRLEEEQTICEMQIKMLPDSLRIIAWTGGDLQSRGRLAGLFRGIARRSTDDKLFGKYRYRFVQMSVDRVELQRVANIVGLPDILPISMKPGVAGAHAQLSPGTIVYVEFIEGNRTLPIVTGFAGKDEQGHAPANLDFVVGAGGQIKVGGAVALAEYPNLNEHLDAIANSFLQAVNALAAATPPISYAPDYNPLSKGLFYDPVKPIATTITKGD